MFADIQGKKNRLVGVAGVLLAAMLLMSWGTLRAEESPLLADGYAYVLQAEGLASDRAGVVRTLAGCGRDWVVVDACFTGGEDGRWTAQEVEEIRRGKPGRKVVCYFSVGEAEDYRDYWQAGWKDVPPAFLLSENPNWPGNYRVRYWDAGWQAIILKELVRIRAQGFDGVLLDIVDGFEYFEQEGGQIVDHKRNPLTGNTYRQDMVNWVIRIASAARAGVSAGAGTGAPMLPPRPDFLVIPQNATQLLSVPEYGKTVSAQALEDLFTVGDKPQPAEHVSYVMSYLRPFAATGRPVLLTEYGETARAKALSRKESARYGLTLLLTDRPLSTLGSQ